MHGCLFVCVRDIVSRRVFVSCISCVCVSLSRCVCECKAMCVCVCMRMRMGL